MVKEIEAEDVLVEVVVDVEFVVEITVVIVVTVGYKAKDTLE